MKLVLMVLIALLIHKESGEVEQVQGCELSGDYLMVNYGKSVGALSFPKSEYDCKIYLEVGVVK